MFVRGEKLTKETDARQLLQLAQARFSSLVRSLPVGLLIVDRSGVIEAANPSALRLLEYDERSIVNRSLQSLFANEPFGADLKGWFDRDPNATVELEAKAKSGDRIPVDLSVRLLDEDTRGRFVVVIQDVSRRYLAEQLKKQFYRAISHDIRAPLSAVSLFLDSLEAGAGVSPVDAQRLAAARSNTRRVVALVESLLDIDRLESGGYKFQVSEFAIGRLIEEALASTRELADAKHVRFAVAGENIILTSDFQRLLQVVVNLLSNAIEHSPSGASIEICAEALDGFATLKVQDHGPGVRDEDKAKIFEQFEQARGNPGRGFGLGLFISSRIMHHLGGSISCADTAGGGATFLCRLPFRDQGDNRRP